MYKVYHHPALGFVVDDIDGSGDNLTDWIYPDKVTVNIPANLYYNIDADNNVELTSSRATGRGSINTGGLIDTGKTYEDFMGLLDSTNTVILKDKEYHGAWQVIGIQQYRQYKCVFTCNMSFKVQYVKDHE